MQPLRKTLLQIAIAIFGAGVISAVLYIGSTNPKTQAPLPITVDGQTINFTWTDENTNETLPIWTDKQTYTNGLSNATVYAAVVNQSGSAQDVELMGYFKDSKRQIKDVSVLTQITTKGQEIFEEVCTDAEIVEKRATSTEEKDCKQVSKGFEPDKTENKWLPLEMKPRDLVAKAIEDSSLSKTAITRKSVDNYIALTKTSDYNVPVGGVLYYKINIDFPANDNGNFFLEAIGSNGAYSHLDPWFNASWTNRIKVEISPDKVDADLTNYPVYVNLDDFPDAFFTNTQADGDDIRVTKSDGSTERPFELVAIDTTAKTGELHFLADSVSNTATTTFYVYYNNPSASGYLVTDTYGRDNVWASNYVGIWHMQANGNDSTSNGYNYTQLNSPSFNSGKLANGMDLGSANTNKGLRITSLLGFSSATEQFTKSLWVKNDTAPNSGEYQVLLNRMYGETSGTQIRFYYYNTSGTLKIVAQNDAGGAINYTQTLTLGAWFHLAITRDSSTLYLYINGTQVSSVAVSGAVNYSSYPDEMTVGIQRTGSGGTFKGEFDEVRLGRGSYKTSTWISTEYNNQSSPSTFYFIGAPETDTPLSYPVEDSSWFY